MKGKDLGGATALRMGVNVPTNVLDRDAAARRALLAEDLGFDYISASDHPGVATPNYETWTMLTWLAARTTRISVATRVLGLPYRSPAMVAKMAETLSRLSAGRLILGLGGGFSDDEFRSLGLDVPTPREKVDGLRDALRIIRGVWSEPSFSYSGSRYHVAEAEIEPKPERPVPIWLGTYGPRALALTGELADGWIPSLGFASRDQLPQMRATILMSAERAGRNPADIECVLNVPVHVGATTTDSEPRVEGSAAQVADELIKFVDMGFTGFNIMPIGDDDEVQLRHFGEQVLPIVRSVVN